MTNFTSADFSLFALWNHCFLGLGNALFKIVLTDILEV